MRHLRLASRLTAIVLLAFIFIFGPACSTRKGLEANPIGPLPLERNPVVSFQATLRKLSQSEVVRNQSVQFAVEVTNAVGANIFRLVRDNENPAPPTVDSSGYFTYMKSFPEAGTFPQSVLVLAIDNTGHTLASQRASLDVVVGSGGVPSSLHCDAMANPPSAQLVGGQPVSVQLSVTATDNGVPVAVIGTYINSNHSIQGSFINQVASVSLSTWDYFLFQVQKSGASEVQATCGVFVSISSGQSTALVADIKDSVGSSDGPVSVAYGSSRTININSSGPLSPANAYTCRLFDGGSVFGGVFVGGILVRSGCSGTFNTPALTSSKTYYLYVSGPGLVADLDFLTYNVQALPQSLTLLANNSLGPITIPNGDPVTLNWAAANSSCSVRRSDTGATVSTALAGPVTVNAITSSSVTFSLTCYQGTVMSFDDVIVNTQFTARGLNADAYPLPAQTHTIGNSLDGRTPTQHISGVANIDVPKHAWTGGFPGFTLAGIGISNWQWFAIRFTGRINITSDGEYSFKVTSDDGARVFIDGTLVVDNDGWHNFKSATGSIHLAPGIHDFREDYFQGPKDHIGDKLEWRIPGSSGYVVVPASVFDKPISQSQVGPVNPPAGTTVLYRFNNGQDHFITANFNEGSQASGYHFEQIAFSVYSAPGGACNTPLYRCLDRGDHFVSTNSSCEGHTREATYGYICPDQQPATVPIYRLYDPIGGHDHLTTISWSEAQLLMSIGGWILESVQGYVPIVPVN